MSVKSLSMTITGTVAACALLAGAGPSGGAAAFASTPGEQAPQATVALPRTLPICC